MNNICILTRPFSTRGFHFLAKHAFTNNNVLFASDWRRTENIWIMREFYLAYDSKTPTETLLNGRDEKQISDIISRCRFLRTLPFEQSCRMVASMFRSAELFIEKQTPDLMVTCHLDCYVYDIISRVQYERGGAYVSIGDTMLSNYGDVNYRFVPMSFRQPADEEIDAFVAKLSQKTFRPAYMVSRYYETRWLQRFVQLYLRHRARQVVFPIRRWLWGDPLSFHLNTIKAAACQQLSWINSDHLFHADWKQRLESSSQSKIFVPLQWYPESRYDYSLLHSDLRDLNLVTKQICEIAANQMVVLKEHPAVLGIRNPQFYRRFLEHDNVCFVPPMVHTSEVAGMCDAIVSFGGTVGMESALRGHRVINLGEPPYHVNGFFESIHTAEQLQRLPELVESPRPLVNLEQLGPAIADKMLSQMLPGGCPYLNFDERNCENVGNLTQFSESLHRHLNAIVDAAQRAAQRYFEHNVNSTKHNTDHDRCVA